MKTSYPNLKALYFCLCLVFSLSFSQAQNSLVEAQSYVEQKGEVTFNIQLNGPSEIEQFSENLSIVNFNDSTNILKVWANQAQFEAFLTLEIPFTVEAIDNVATDIVMSNEIISPLGRANTLSFPLNAYPTYSDYAQQMQDFANDYPNLCQLVDLGPTTEGDKNILFVKISDNISTNEQEPRLLYTSSMHGDEIAGYPMMIELINYFLTVYSDTNHSDHLRIKDLIDNSEIWINPSANPDGTYYNDPTNTSVSNSRRANHNGIDLNRNYPDNVGGAHPDGEVYQTETQYFMTLADNNHFVLSANFHGGVEVVNYPWDNTYDLHPDDAWYQFISREYADNCQANSPGAPNYMTYLDNGITNGADWYRVEGGRQDYMNFYHQCKETTIELSDVKTIPANQINNHWNYNKEALIEYLIQGTYGFTGVVKDAITGNPIEAKVTLVGHDNLGSHTVTELPHGDFYRPTIAGTYDILFEAECYLPFTLSGQVLNNYEKIVLPDVMLNPVSGAAPTNLSANNIGPYSADLSWDNILSANYDYQYREVGSSSWITTNTSSNSVNLSGLQILSQYEARVRANCDSNSSAYSNTIQFTTSDIPPCIGTPIVNLPYLENFDSGAGDWTQGSGDDGNWTHNSGGTTSSNTGPSDDVTNGGSYFYTEASNNNDPGPNATVYLESPCFELTNYTNSLFSFYYHMRGNAMGTLSLEISADNGSTWNQVFTLSGNQGNSWNQQNVNLGSYDGQVVKLRFIGETGGGFRSDMAIDQIELTGNFVDNQDPTAPTNLIASNTAQTTTDLSWNAATDNVGVTEYEIYQDAALVTTVSGTSHQITGLSPSTTYSFYVIAKDAVGNSSPQSNIVNVTTLDPPDTENPTAPANLIVNNTTQSSTDLSWDAATDNVAVTEYEIYQNSVLLTTATGTSFQVTGLTPSTSYNFYVIAKDAAGNSSNQSNTVNVLTLEFMDVEDPTAPTNLVANITTQTTTDLSWNAATDNVGVTEYEVYQDAALVTTVSGTGHQVTGLSNSTTYSFYVIAKDAAGNSSAQSNTVNVTTLDPPDTEAPTTPTNLVANNTTQSSTDLSWDAASDNVAVTAYEIYQDAVLLTTLAGTSFQVTGLTPSTTYDFYVIAKDAAGNSSSQSNLANIMTLEFMDIEDPTPPTNLVASNTAQTTADLSWNAATDNVGVTEYEIYQDAALVTTVSGTSHQVTGLSPSTTYSFYIIAKDAAGNSSSQSNTVNVTTLDPPDTEAPTAPTNLVANNTTQSSTDLSWNAASDNIAVTAYEIYQDAVLLTTVAGTTFQVTGLTPSTTYNFYVIAKDAAGNSSSQSNLVNLITEDIIISYCASSSSNVNDEYISRVQLNTIDNNSDAQFYSDFTNISTSLRKGQLYTITITPTWPGTIYDEGYSVWIDYNQDGDFEDSGEQVWSQTPVQTSPVSGDFTIPSSALLNNTRMRVTLKYDEIPTSCENFTWGEVEDYTINIIDEDVLLFSNNVWDPYAPSDTTNLENALVLDGTYLVNANININDITVAQGATLEIEKAQSLTVLGNLTVNGNATLNSDSDEYSSLIVDGNFSGSLDYNRHVNINASSGGNDLISAPVYGQRFSDFATTNSNIVENPSNTSQKLFGPFNKTSGSYQIFDTDNPADANHVFSSGEGYRGASTNNSTFTFTGAVNTENINVNIPISGPNYEEWNLIGNPYPSYIKLSDFLAVNSSQLADPNVGIYGYDGNASDGWTIWNLAYSLANPNAIITPGQGFFVASANIGSSIDFTQGMRSIGSADDFILGRNSSIANLKLELNSNEQSYKTDIYFTELASLGLDPGFDATVFSGNAPNFAIFSQLVEESAGLDMAIQSISQLNLDNTIIPLGVNANAGQQLTIGISDSTLDNNISVYLEDRLLNIFTLLNSGDYTFTSETDLSGIGRFYLRFESETLTTIEQELNALQIFYTNNPKLIQISGFVSENSILSLFDLNGRIILKESIKSGYIREKIPVRNLQNGVYIVDIKNNSIRKTKKIMVH